MWCIAKLLVLRCPDRVLNAVCDRIVDPGLALLRYDPKPFSALALGLKQPESQPLAGLKP